MLYPSSYAFSPFPVPYTVQAPGEAEEIFEAELCARSVTYQTDRLCYKHCWVTLSLPPEGGFHRREGGCVCGGWTPREDI